MRSKIAMLAALVIVPLMAEAAEPKPVSELDRPISLGELTPTPEMWFYQQEQKAYDNPKLAVRQKAEFRAAQRQMRLAACRWYGVDNARPSVSFTPFQGETYGPSFAGSRDPNVWLGNTNTPVVIGSRRDGYRTNW